MKLNLTDEEKETLSYDDVAYLILKNTNKKQKIQDLFKRVLNKDINAIYEPVGCDDCFNGYKGRAAVHEVLLLNQE